MQDKRKEIDPRIWTDEDLQQDLRDRGILFKKAFGYEMLEGGAKEGSFQVENPRPTGLRREYRTVWTWRWPFRRREVVSELPWWPEWIGTQKLLYRAEYRRGKTEEV